MERRSAVAREVLLARTFVELADTLTDDFDVAQLCGNLVGRCVELFDATAAGLLLAGTDGALQASASSGAALRLVHLFEVEAMEGPDIECYLSGEPVIVEDVDQCDGRWSRFAPVALGAGYRSVHVLPVRARDQMIGTL